MEVFRAMPDSVEGIAYTVGGALVSPGVGSAELLVSALVALAFVASAVQTWLSRGRHVKDWRERRF